VFIDRRMPEVAKETRAWRAWPPAITSISLPWSCWRSCPPPHTSCAGLDLGDIVKVKTPNTIQQTTRGGGLPSTLSLNEAEVEYQNWFNLTQTTGAQWKGNIEKAGEIRGLLGQLTLSALDTVGPTVAGLPVIIGREPGAGTGMQLLDPSASRKHFAVKYDAELERFSIADLGSANGTSLNGRKLAPPPAESTLTDDDEIIAGDSVLMLSIEIPDDRASALAMVRKMTEKGKSTIMRKPGDPRKIWVLVCMHSTACESALL
jgi:pSer/pThr/pTyr-binding forkhead associated (FHA) protein